MECCTLIVEDHRFLASALRSNFTNRGYKVHVAYDQREAYALLDQGGFDLVLLDLRLPTDEEDLRPDTEVGFAVLDHIRDRFTPEELPVVIMTGCPEKSGLAARAFRASANDFIPKPFDSDLFYQKISGVLARRDRVRRPPNARRHKIVFGKGYVEIDGIKVNGRVHQLLAALGNQALRDFSGRGELQHLSMTGRQIADELGMDEPAVRRLIYLFRKRMASECRNSEKDPPGEQDIIRNSRDWQGYELNVEETHIDCE